MASGPPSEGPTAPEAPLASNAAEALARRANAELEPLALESSQASWVYATFITEETEAISSRAEARLIKRCADLAKEAVAALPSAPGPEVRRQLELLRISMPMVAPSGAGKAEELTRCVATMTARYSKGRYQPKGVPESLDLQGLDRLLGESHDPAQLADAWVGWHEIAVAQRPEFIRYVELSNEGSRELGFADAGEMWRASYDLPPDEFAREVDRLWLQLKPLYDALHAYVRRKLRERYPTAGIPERGPIPAHFLGNMWAQNWEALYPMLAPPDSGPGVDLTALLKAKGTQPLDMVRYAERFFTSLGFEPLPATFWTRSMFERPRDREVVCHASAWDIDSLEDLRIKMCIELTGEDFRTIHHELGHNFYQRAYMRQPFLFRGGANDGFHEAIGDTIALSVTPEYLVKVGLLDRAPGAERDLGLLLRGALSTVAFLPFGLLIDRWRWEVFSGKVGPADYNAAWWRLRRDYQGVGPPSDRTDQQFDAAGKFHVANNTPYMRYFLAQVLQYQFHRALARVVGWTGPVHRASIYGNQEAGRLLNRMLEMGTSRPWPDALEAMTGERRMDASALLEYFAPLHRWLDEQNRGHPVGW